MKVLRRLMFLIPITPKSVQHGARAKLARYPVPRIIYYNDPEKELYVHHVTEEIKHQAPAEPLMGPLSVRFAFYLPRPKSLAGIDSEPAWTYGGSMADWDNLSKGLQDALSRAGVWKNDAQVWKCDGVERRYCEAGLMPRIEVTVTQYENNKPDKQTASETAERSS